MYRKLIITTFLAAGLAHAPGADAAVNKCKVRGSTTIAKSGASRAYTADGDTIACLKKTGQRITLEGAGAIVTVKGPFAAFSSQDEDGVESVVNVQRITDGGIPQFMPQQTGGDVQAIVLKNNGAAAWAVSPLDDPEMTYVQGNERNNHAPHLYSDNELGGVDASTLTSEPGAGISWLYTDGTSGSGNLFTGPAQVF